MASVAEINRVMTIWKCNGSNNPLKYSIWRDLSITEDDLKEMGIIDVQIDSCGEGDSVGGLILFKLENPLKNCTICRGKETELAKEHP